MSRPHAHSTAATKRERRRENWGTANTVRPTRARAFADRGHQAPRHLRDRHGLPWRGTSTVPARKRSTKRRSTWRDWYRETFLHIWRTERRSDRGAA